MMTGIALAIAVFALLCASAAFSKAEAASKRADYLAVKLVEAKTLSDANASAMNQNFAHVVTTLEGLDVLNRDATLKGFLQPAPRRIR